MAPGQPVKGLASEIFLSNLSLELNTVGSVLGHGFHPLKAQRSRSIPNVQPVHPQGRTPIRGQTSKPIDTRVEAFYGRAHLATAKTRVFGTPRVEYH